MNLRMLLFVLSMTLTAVAGWAQDGRSAVQERLEATNLDMGTLQWQITSEHTSAASGIQHIYFQQLVDDIPVLGTESSVHLSLGGTIIAESIQFLPIGDYEWMGDDSENLSPIQALKAVSKQRGYKITRPITIQNKEKKLLNEIWLSNGGISARDISAQLGFIRIGDNSFTQVWILDILQPNNEHWWEFYVDARSGEILTQEDRMQTCDLATHETDVIGHKRDRFGIKNYYSLPPNTPVSCTECYEVIPYPLESPYFGDRVIIENPAHPVASPYGWHDIDGIPGAEYTTTQGNNVDAYESNNNFGYHPDGGSSLEFVGYDFDTEFSNENQYEDASITNLFYWTNLIHDITYQYGFTEAAGNFQVNNYNRGGKGGDDINTFGQSVLRRCNGSFSTPMDGLRPHMVINICRNKDGDFDSTLIAHEWGHGLSNRLTGGGAVVNCLRNTENPQEGWSDWLATMLTMRPGDTGNTPRYIASYLRDHGPNGPGVRFYPYSTNMADNPLTYGDLPYREGIHRIGAIWGTMIWEMTWSLIDEYGYDPDIYNFTGDINQDAGNIMAMAIVIEGMKLTACRPGFVDARDGIVTAARQIYGREVLCYVWEAFAKRGLGFGADQGDSDNQFDGTPSFATPYEEPYIVLDNEVFCFESAIYVNQSGGRPLGGVYTGLGVTDNGDGVSFDFDPSIAGVGTHTITYLLGGIECAFAESISVDVVVENDVTPPEFDCITDTFFTVPLGQPYELYDFWSAITAVDYCPGELTYGQFPEPGSLLTNSENEITLTVADGVGNESRCTFLLTLVFVSEEEIASGNLIILPNPARDEISLINPKEKNISAIELWDMVGRRVINLELENSEIENRFSVEHLSAGTYFIIISVGGSTEVIQLLKL